MTSSLKKGCSPAVDSSIAATFSIIGETRCSYRWYFVPAFRMLVYPVVLYPTAVSIFDTRWTHLPVRFFCSCEPKSRTWVFTNRLCRTYAPQRSKTQKKTPAVKTLSLAARLKSPLLSRPRCRLCRTESRARRENGKTLGCFSGAVLELGGRSTIPNHRLDLRR